LVLRHRSSAALLRRIQLPAPHLFGSPTPPCSTAAPLHRHLVSSAAFPTRARGIRVCRRLEKTTAYNPPAAVCSAWDNGTAASPREATGRPSASRVGGYLQMCSIPTGLYRRVVHALTGISLSSVHNYLRVAKQSPLGHSSYSPISLLLLHFTVLLSLSPIKKQPNLLSYIYTSPTFSFFI
jgi:hypothetical protein